MRICGSQRPSIPTSARKSSCWARPRGGSHVIWSSSRFVQILWLCSCLTIKDLWSNLKWSRVAFFISPQSIAEWYPFTGAVFSEGEGYRWLGCGGGGFHLLTARQTLDERLWSFLVFQGFEFGCLCQRQQRYSRRLKPAVRQTKKYWLEVQNLGKVCRVSNG